jgi:hypothetical protein
VFENTALRRIFGTNTDGVTGSRKKFYNNYHNFYSSPDIRIIKSRKMKLARTAAHMKNVYKILIKEHDMKR